MEDLAKHLYSRKLKTKISYFTQINGKYVPLGSNEFEAKKKLAALMGTNRSDTIEFMCKSYIEKQRRLLKDGDRNALAPRTVDDYENDLVKFVIPTYGAFRPRDFKPFMKAQYLSRCAQTNRATRGNREMSALGSAFNHGMVLGLVDSNPTLGVRRNREHPRRRDVTVKEFNAFLEFARAEGGSKYLVALIGALVAISGRRRAEILALPMSAITDAGIRCKSAKVKAGEEARYFLIRDSDLLRQLVAEIKGIPRRVSSMFLFANEDGQVYKDTGFCTLWHRLMGAYVGSGGTRFHAHDLRAMYVSLMLAAKENPETHQNEETMRRVYDRRGEIEVTPLGSRGKR
jgi:integrase